MISQCRGVHPPKLIMNIGHSSPISGKCKNFLPIFVIFRVFWLPPYFDYDAWHVLDLISSLVVSANSSAVFFFPLHLLLGIRSPTQNSPDFLAWGWLFGLPEVFWGRVMWDWWWTIAWRGGCPNWKTRPTLDKFCSLFTLVSGYIQSLSFWLFVVYSSHTLIGHFFVVSFWLIFIGSIRWC